MKNKTMSETRERKEKIEFLIEKTLACLLIACLCFGFKGLALAADGSESQADCGEMRPLTDGRCFAIGSNNIRIVDPATNESYTVPLPPSDNVVVDAIGVNNGQGIQLMYHKPDGSYAMSDIVSVAAAVSPDQAAPVIATDAEQAAAGASAIFDNGSGAGNPGAGPVQPAAGDPDALPRDESASDGEGGSGGSEPSPNAPASGSGEGEGVNWGRHGYGALYGAAAGGLVYLGLGPIGIGFLGSTMAIISGLGVFAGIYALSALGLLDGLGAKTKQIIALAGIGAAVGAAVGLAFGGGILGGAMMGGLVGLGVGLLFGLIGWLTKKDE